ncbi:MAG: DUF5302 domain-containing protein [Ornithinimicrobium sp.]
MSTEQHDETAERDESDEQTALKRKFREALEKKNSHGGADVSDTGDQGKVTGAQEAKTSGAQQMFRRKSG